MANGEEIGETWHLDASTWSLWSRFGDIFSIIPRGHEVGISESANCSRNKDWPDMGMT